MEDRCQEVLKKYNLKVYNIVRARGAYLLETDQGLKLLKCFEGSKSRAEFEDRVKEHLVQKGYGNSDRFVRTQESEMITEDGAGSQYMIKDWFWGEECNLRELSQIEAAAANLASLHMLLKNVEFDEGQIDYNISPDLRELFDKRNRELKRVRSYIRDKKQKNEFELSYLNYYEAFYAQGQEASQALAESDYERLRSEAIRERLICHGNYTYHNILMVREKGDGALKNTQSSWMNRQGLSAAELPGTNRMNLATTNFDKAQVGIQITDLYQFIRKVMEKNDWDILYGNNMIEAYDKIKPISKEELNLLYILLLYPEKFWKITNFYFNSKKSWISGRNIQKLNSIGEQNEKKAMFLERLAGIL